MYEFPTDAEGRSTFECADCRTRVPSTWVDYDILGYSICPDCGRTQSPMTGFQFLTGSALQ